MSNQVKMLGRQSLWRLCQVARHTLHSNKALASAAHSSPGASAHPSGSQGAAQGARSASKQQQAAARAGAAKGSEEPIKFESSSKIGWVIPGLGFPGLVGWYLYDQIYVQLEHDAYIQSLHDGIQERREKLASSTSLH